MSLQIGGHAKRKHATRPTRNPYTPFAGGPTGGAAAFAPEGILLDDPTLAASIEGIPQDVMQPSLDGNPYAELPGITQTQLPVDPRFNPYATDELSAAVGQENPAYRGTGPSRIYDGKYLQGDAAGRTENFRLLKANAEIASRASGVPVKTIMAQQIQENGWNKKKLTGKNNYFNIKADKSWKGPKSKHRVWEVVNGKDVMVDAWFRDYDSSEASAKDYASFLQKNPRYSRVLGGDLTPEQAAIELQRAGYATDPTYADKMIQIMNGRSFQQLNNTI